MSQKIFFSQLKIQPEKIPAVIRSNADGSVEVDLRHADSEVAKEVVSQLTAATKQWENIHIESQRLSPVSSWCVKVTPDKIHLARFIVQLENSLAKFFTLQGVNHDYHTPAWCGWDPRLVYFEKSGIDISKISLTGGEVTFHAQAKDLKVELNRANQSALPLVCSELRAQHPDLFES